jgi:hypothetical protein
MDKDELDIYLEIAKEAEISGDYRTADKIDNMIRTSGFDRNKLPAWAKNFIEGARTPAERATRLRQILDGIRHRGTSNFINDLGYARRLRRKRGLPADELSHEKSSPAVRGDVGDLGSTRSKITNLFFTRGKATYESLQTRFKEEVDAILPDIQRAIDNEIARLKTIPANRGLSDDQLKTMALQSSTVTMFIRRLRTPMAALLHRTQQELKRKIEEAADLIQNDPVTRRELRLTGPFNARTDINAANIGRVISARYEKFLGPGSEISGEMFDRFYSSGRLVNGVFTGGRIDPTYFFTKQGGAKLLPTGLSYIIPAMFAGGTIVKIIDPPGPKPGPDVPPVGGNVVKNTNELAADRIPAGQFRTPITQLQAYILGKQFRGAFHPGKTTKKELYNMAIQERGEAFANDLIQYAIKTYGLKGVGLGERDSPVGL